MSKFTSMESSQGYVSNNSESIGGMDLRNIFGLCSSEYFLSVVSKFTSMESSQVYVSDNSELNGGMNLSRILRLWQGSNHHQFLFGMACRTPRGVCYDRSFYGSRGVTEKHQRSRKSRQASECGLRPDTYQKPLLCHPINTNSP